MISVQNWTTELYYTFFFPIFHIELEYVTFEMIQLAIQSNGLKISNPLTLLLKQTEALGLGSLCAKIDCPSF